uniref:Uncharacterized protein n=1 Tax=Cannabis sativa TaxID=3483 RepID=A0A803NN61_CANSA
MSINPVQEFPPRPVWLERKLEKVICSDIHKCFSKEGTLGITINLKLLIIVGVPQSSGQRVVIDQNSGERSFQSVGVYGGRFLVKILHLYEKFNFLYVLICLPAAVKHCTWVWHLLYPEVAVTIPRYSEQYPIIARTKKTYCQVNPWVLTSRLKGLSIAGVKPHRLGLITLRTRKPCRGFFNMEKGRDGNLIDLHYRLPSLIALSRGDLSVKSNEVRPNPSGEDVEALNNPSKDPSNALVGPARPVPADKGKGKVVDLLKRKLGSPSPGQSKPKLDELDVDSLNYLTAITLKNVAFALLKLLHTHAKEVTNLTVENAKLKELDLAEKTCKEKQKELDALQAHQTLKDQYTDLSIETFYECYINNPKGNFTYMDTHLRKSLIAQGKELFVSRLVQDSTLEASANQNERIGQASTEVFTSQTKDNRQVSTEAFVSQGANEAPSA